MTELPDNASPAQATAWAERRLAEGFPLSHLQLAASKIGAYARNTAAARAILAVANRPRP